MSAKYTIRRGPHGDYSPVYDVLNPSGVAIAFNCSWRVARKIADALNNPAPELVQVGVLCGVCGLRPEIEPPYCAHKKFCLGDIQPVWGAVSLQEEA